MFRETFANWDIWLPAGDVASYLPGKLFQAGWTVHYLFGDDEGEEYLDYHAIHRMTNPRRVRIHSDGRVEGLKTPREFVVYPAGSGEVACRQIRKEFDSDNREVDRILPENGFGPG